MEERKAVHVSAHQRGNTYNKHCLVAWMRSFFHLKYLFLTLVYTQLTDIYTTSTESEFIPDCSRGVKLTWASSCPAESAVLFQCATLPKMQAEEECIYIEVRYTSPSIWRFTLKIYSCLFKDIHHLRSYGQGMGRRHTGCPLATSAIP